MRWLFAIALGCVVVGGAPAARADSQAEARTLLKEGNRLLEAGDYVGALDMYHSAYSRVPSVKILLNIGTALRQLGRDAEAADTYEKYLNDSAADPSRRPEVQKLLDELNLRVGKLRIEVNEPGARVLVDGKSVGSSPQAVSMRVEPGSHTIVAEKEGYALAAATVSIAARQERVVELRLMSSAPTPPAAAPTTPPPVAQQGAPTSPPAAAVAATPSAPDTIVKDEEASAQHARKRRWMWVGIGAGVVAVAVVGLAVGLSLSGSSPPRTNAGTFTATFH